MKNLFIPLLFVAGGVMAQDHMTPEMLWSLKRVSAGNISKDRKTLTYTVKQYDWHTEASKTLLYTLDLAKGTSQLLTPEDKRKLIDNDKAAVFVTGDNKTLMVRSKDDKNKVIEYPMIDGVENIQVSPDGQYAAFSREVLVTPMMGTDIYADLPNTTAQVYRDLNDRHWDTWEDGKYSHVFIMDLKTGKTVDLLDKKAYDCPQKPFGGAEDFVWAPDSKGLVYVCKKKEGKEYAQSTNTDIYYYNIATDETLNWTMGMMGYDMSPAFSKDGKYMAFTSMARDGYEADKTDIYIMALGSKDGYKINLTGAWDGTVEGFTWSDDNKSIYFNAPWHGTVQLFEAKLPAKLNAKTPVAIRQVTDGKFDVNGLVGQAGKEMIVSRCDMNHISELYAVDMEKGSMRQLTHENDATYNSINLSNTELRYVTTTDGQKMGVWVIYPPNFDPNKKYPTLLYCHGGPQSALSQFYSIRWNFQLMAANGYIVVAPNRRGMPGWGVKWNEDISKDWGGQPMRDYLSAIDEISKEYYVDKDRLGCVGASYGGYSVYMLAGMHEKRFKTFIAHDGLFDLKSWYGTTEELWFANWDIEGAYWKKPTPASYEKFNPSNFVDKWTAPIMIVQGGIDYRVPIEQGLEAFQAAQLRGIKSKLLYFPNENHWVLHANNGIAWQREFFKWLSETL